MKKRFLATLLAVTLCLGLLPAPALGVEEPAPFTPESLGGLLAWYDANSVVKDEQGNIGKLVNKAVTGVTYDAVQDTADAKPHYEANGTVKTDAPAIRLRDGDYMRIGGENGFDLEDMTIVAVLNVDALTATVGNKSSQICSRKKPGSGDHNWYFNVTSEKKPNSVNFGWKEAGADKWCSVDQGGAEITPKETYTLIARKSGANGAVNVNGVKANFEGATTPQKNTSPVYLGTPTGYTDNEVSLNADYAAFLIFNRGLTDEETAQLEAYLTETYLPETTDPDPGPDPEPGDSVPESIPGLKAWYDATTLELADGAKVEAWPDLAKDGVVYNAVQSTPANQPTYQAASDINRKPGVRLDKGTFLEVENSFGLDDMSIFAVMRADTLEGDGDSNQIFSKLGNRPPWDHNWYFNISNNGFNYGWKDDIYHDYKGEGRAMSANVNYVLGGVKAGNDGSLYMNGNRFGTMTGNGNPIHNDAPIYIGGKNNQSVKGVISEIIVYDRGLTAEQAEQVNDYLLTKWGIEKADSTEPVDGTISINGEALRAFSTNCTTYKHVLADTTVPKVTADFSGATVNIEQADAVPGVATVTVTKGGLTAVYRIEFSDFGREIVGLQSPTVEQVEITGGFWKERLDLFYTETIDHVFDNFERTGTLRNFEKVGTQGARPEGSTDPWNDGLLYETIRGASDFMRSNPDTPEFAALKERIDGYIATIYTTSVNESENGYLSTWAMMERPGQYFDATENARWYHDAYNFGCMAEAAVHYYKATGESESAIKLLYVATRYAEFLVDNYGYGLKKDGTPKINMIPSHEGPEEMLLKLYQLYREEAELKTTVEALAETNGDTWSIAENEYADLVKFWIENHGNYDGRVNGANYGEYAQDHDRYFNQDVAKGHAVRANLFYTGIAAAGREFTDYTYLTTAENLWQNIVDKQMYITGGVGAQGHDEAYGPDYDLPNNGYCETCAQVAMGFFSEYMGLTFAESKYADLVERYIYDGVLGAVGDTGETFYYQQPLSDKERGRWDWIDHTPCCPPMFLKFYGEMPAYLYAYTGSEVYVNQFVSSKLTVGGMTVTQESGMPWGGTSTFATGGVTKLHVRLPEWATEKSKGEVVITVDDKAASYTTENGYAVVDVSGGKTVSVTFPMEARREYSDPKVVYNEGKVALAYGPMVYCVESTDVPLYVPNFNKGDGNLGIPATAELTTQFEPDLLGGVQTISFTGEYYNGNGEKQEVETKAIPFFARSNRGKSSTFVWLDEEVKVAEGKLNRWLAAADQSRGVGNSAAAAFDGKTETFWAAGGPEVPQALMVDLGEVKTVGKVSTTFTSAQAWKYQVLTSLDGVTWETFADNSSNATNQKVFTDTGSKQARYVAVKFVESAGVGYISVQEIAVMEADSEVNLALNKLCASSTVSTVTDSVFAMIDGNKETRYCPPNNDKPRVLTFDLGAQADITGMEILFEKPTKWTYKLEVSSDGKTWTDYHSETYNMTENVVRLIEKETTGRYVRFTITETTDGVWASVWEFNVLTKEPLPDLFDAILDSETPDPDPELPEPALYYDFTDGVKDQSGNGKDAVIHGDVSILGGMALLSGGYIQLPDNLTNTDEITISAWVWHSEGQSNARVFDLGGTDQHRYYNLMINDKNVPMNELRKLEDLGTMQTVRNDDAKVMPGEWVHVVSTFKNGEANLYVDGTLAATQDGITLTSPKDLGETTRNYLGKSRFSKPETSTNFNDPNFLGLYKEVKVYNTVLTAEQVLAEASKTDGQEKAADAQKLKAAISGVNLGDLGEVFGNLTLPAEQDGLALSWTSSKPEILSNTGAYTAPAEDTEVILTATATLSGMTLTRDFTATVVRRTDAQIAQADAKALGLVTLVDSETLYLPTSGKRGSTITWDTSDPGVITAGGKVTQPASGQGSKFVDLTATIRYGGEQVVKQFEDREVMERYGAFLLTYFGGNELKGNVESEYATVHFAYSYDGLHWVPLNDNEHVVAATIMGKDNPAYGQDRPNEALARDPMVVRQQDGKLRLLSSHSWNNHDIYVWDAGDLTSFSGERILSVNTDKGNAWAPEVVYDPVQEQYMVVFTDPANSGACGYGTYTTDFTQADVDGNKALGLTNIPLMDLSKESRTYIDCSMYAYGGSYYMPFRYWTRQNPYNGVALAKSDSLEPNSFRVIDAISDESIGDGNNEGPFIIKDLDRDRWYMYYDYPDCGSGEEWGMFGVSYTDDLDSGVWNRVPFDEYTMPYGVRHGNAIPITTGELDKLIEAHGAPDTLDVAQLSTPVVNAQVGTAFTELALPEQVSVILQDGTTTTIPVTWQSDNYRAEAGRYKVYGTFALPDGISNTKDFRPFVTVCAGVEAKEGLVADLDFTAVDGSVALDKSGYGNHMTFVNEPEVVESDRGGKALVMDGINNATMPKELLMNMDSATIAFWAKMDEARNWARVFDFGKGQSNYINFIPKTGEDGNIRVEVRVYNEMRMIKPGIPFPVGEWTHVAVTLDPATLQGVLYLNGEEVGRSDSFYYGPQHLGMNKKNQIGKAQFPDPLFKGQLGAFQVYDYALTATQVKMLAAPDEVCMLTASAVGGGSIDPSGQIPVLKGASQTFQVRANEGYQLDSFRVNDEAIRPNADGSYTVDNIQEDMELKAYFSAVSTSSGGSNTTTKTEKNEDGSTTKTVTDKKTGGVTETTTYPDGTKIVATTPKGGNTSIEVTIPKDKDGVTVTIPTAEKPKPGEVAVIVRPDGTREVIKTSVATEAGLKVTLTEGAKLEIVDNSKSFGDVADVHWAANAIQFAASRELFQGNGDSFAPESTMTRGMLMTVLYRLEGAQVVSGGDKWYSDALAWSKEQGISDGTDPEADISREQLAVILYRYMGSPETSDVELSEFDDMDGVSGWATDAMRWAVATGLLQGSGSKLNPGRSASRAEVAMMLQRFITKMM